MLSADEKNPAMLGEHENKSHENKSIGKSGQRNRKSKQQSAKTGERNRKPVQEEKSKQNQSQAAEELVSAGSSESYPTDSALAESALADADQAGSVAFGQGLQDAPQEVNLPTTSREISSSDGTHTNIEEAGIEASADPMPVSLQSLAEAYEDYVRNSFEQSRLFVEKLASVRSLDGALELQTDFMKQACEAFITETQKIRDIHRGLANQRLAYLEGFVAKMAPVAFIQRASGS